MSDAAGSYGETVISVGLLFLGSAYRPALLEKSGRESLTVDLSSFDCMTYVETVLALAACAHTGKINRSLFRKKLKYIRYRGGKIDGYASRLHYFTDWLCDNGRKQVLRDDTRRLGGKTYRKKINFMTAHRDLYPALKKESEFQKLLILEKGLTRKSFHVIPREDLACLVDQIRQGDVIAFTTNQAGLDVAHAGFAFRQGRRLCLLHASSKKGAVVISRQPLSAYLKAHKKFTGVIVARPLSERSESV
jgi:hypothetical protein